MNHQVVLEQREKRRRAALRKLYAPDLGDSHAALPELREILEQDHTSPLGEASALSIAELRELFPPGSARADHRRDADRRTNRRLVTCTQRGRDT